MELVSFLFTELQPHESRKTGARKIKPKTLYLKREGIQIAALLMTAVI